MAPHSSTLAWKIPWTEEPGGCSPWVTKSDTTEQFHFHFSLSCIGEGNGNPLQCSCLENPRDGRAWWAAVYGVAQSQTQLKRLSKQASRQAQNTAVSESAVTIKLSILKHSTKPRQESSLQGTQGLLQRCQRHKKSREIRSRVDSKWVAYFCIPNDVKENSNYC